MSASAIILSMTAENNSCSTCKSAGDAVFLLFLMENNFHHFRHRKVATRHTLPSIQISLSLSKFSMMEASSCPCCLPAVRLISGSLPPVAKESLMVGNKLLTWGETASVDYEIPVVGLL